MSIALVQQVAQRLTIGGSTAKTVTISTPVAGNALRLLLFCYNSNTISSVTGGGVTWTKTANIVDTDSLNRSELWEGDNSSGSGTTITINVSSTYGTVEVNVSEWSGMPTTKVVDGGPSTNTGTSGTNSTASVTPTAGKEVLLLAVGTVTDSTTLNNATVAGGFTALNRSATATWVGFAYQIVASASGSYSASWTLGVSYYRWASIIAGWDGAAGASGPLAPGTKINQSVKRAAFY